MNAYQKREQTRRERVLDAAARKGNERRACAMEHADAVLNRYEDAYRLRYPGKALPAMTFDPKTGYFHVDGKPMRENVLTTAADFMYASAHAQEIDKC